MECGDWRGGVLYRSWLHGNGGIEEEQKVDILGGFWKSRFAATPSSSSSSSYSWWCSWCRSGALPFPFPGAGPPPLTVTGPYFLFRVLMLWGKWVGSDLEIERLDGINLDDQVLVKKRQVWQWWVDHEIVHLNGSQLVRHLKKRCGAIINTGHRMTNRTPRHHHQSSRNHHPSHHAASTRLLVKFHAWNPYVKFIYFFLY